MRRPVIDWGAFERLSPELKEQAAPLLAAVAGDWEQNPLLRFWPLYQQQADFLAATERTKLFAGGNQAGKTTIGVVDDLIQAVDRDCLPEHLKAFKHFEPPFLCRIVTPDFTETMEGVIYEKLREWAPKDQLLGGSWEEAYKKAERRLHFRNGSKFQFLTAEQDVDKHAGQKLDRVHFDEEPPGEKGLKLYRENRQRVLARDGQVMLTMTPLFGMSWAYDELYEQRHEDWIFYTQADQDQNTTLSEVAKREARRGLSREELQARKEGKFVHFGGLVLARFTDDLKVPAVSRKDLEGQDIYVGIDPGIARGGVVWAALDRDNVMLVFDELYPANETIPQIAQQIRERNEFWKVDPAYIIDPSSRNRQHVNAENVQGALMREGIFCAEGQNDRRTGILQLRARIDARALLVAENCVNWLRERDRWRVADDESTGESRPADGDSFRTLGADHLMDPTRYVAMARVWWEPLADEEPERSMQDYLSAGEVPDSRELFAGVNVEGPPLGSMS